ncbi:MAG: TIGR00282 family metallophosphoesterase [Clostridia bacterium]|nr:TIGR00282 family metallophosphoesterase [Clostridia bacterium]
MSVVKILAVGDVVGKPGTEFFKKNIPAYKRYAGIDLCIVNAENSAPGNGTTPDSAKELLTWGADILTGGNHSFKRREFYEYLDTNAPCLRPANYPEGAPGRGWCIYETARLRVCVISLLGTVFMENLDNPFRRIDDILRIPEVEDCKIKIVDFHAEATSEKEAMGFFLDGRVTALFGTHTHVQTADERILPGGTGYITDLGMTGSVDTVIGVDKNEIISMFLTRMPLRFSNPETACRLSGCVIEADTVTGQCLNMERISLG